MQNIERGSPPAVQPPPTSPQQSPRESMLRLPISQPTVTYAILGLLVVIYLIQMVTDQQNYPDQPVLEWGAMIFYNVLHGEYYRLVTAMFLHGSLPHLFFNAYALYIYGRLVEGFFGHVRFALIYLLGGLCGSVASFLLTRGASVGASGAIFAIFGAYIAFLYHNRKLFGARASQQLRSLIILAVVNLAIGIYSNIAPQGFGGMVIDNWAHVGGFFSGLFLSWFLAPRWEVRPAPVPGGQEFAAVDTNPLSKNWLFPASFAAGLVLIFVYALNTLGGSR